MGYFERNGLVNNTSYFKKQLAISEDCERLFSHWLESRGWTIEAIGEAKTGYDIKAIRDGLELAWEIKYNSGIKKYKTIFAETFQSGYPSGLQKTTADYQVHFNEDLECRVMKTSDMRKYVIDNDIPLSLIHI